MYHVPIKSYSGLKKQSKWSVQLPGIDLSRDKNAIFAVMGSGVGRWPRPRYCTVIMVKSFYLGSSIANRYSSQKGVRYVNLRLLDL